MRRLAAIGGLCYKLEPVVFELVPGMGRGLSGHDATFSVHGRILPTDH